MNRFQPPSIISGTAAGRSMRCLLPAAGCRDGIRREVDGGAQDFVIFTMVIA